MIIKWHSFLLYLHYTISICFWSIIFGAILFVPRLYQEMDANTLYVLTWPGLVDSNYVKNFTKKTGINVVVRYYDSNQELLSKLITTHAKGYDLIITSDYVVSTLVERNLLKSLDFSKIFFYDTLNPVLLHHYFDQNNTHSLPYYWALYGIVSTKSFQSSEKSWQLLFDKNLETSCVAMLNEPRELFLIAALAHFKRVQNLSPQDLPILEAMLKNQKKKVALYTEADVNIDKILLSGTASRAVSTTPYMAKILKETSLLHFFIPNEGTFSLLDNVVIPQSTTKENLIYPFINFLYESETIEYNTMHYAFIPATKNFAAVLRKAQAPESIITMHQQVHYLNFFKDTFNADLINKAWLSIKSLT